MKYLARRAIGVALLVAAVAMAAAAANAQDNSAYDVANQPWIGTDAPTFALDAGGGVTVDLAELRGKYVVIHFGASW